MPFLTPAVFSGEFSTTDAESLADGHDRDHGHGHGRDHGHDRDHGHGHGRGYGPGHGLEVGSWDCSGASPMNDRIGVESGSGGVG